MLTNRHFKLFTIYLAYNLFIKAFYAGVSPILYIENSDINYNISFLPIEWSAPFSFFGNVYALVVLDLFWLFPFTIMNLHLYINLIQQLLKSRVGIYQIQSFVILRTYLIWCAFYCCAICFNYWSKGTNSGGLFSGPFSPYSDISITYLLLGNFVFMLFFVPLWNLFVREWLERPEP